MLHFSLVLLSFQAQNLLFWIILFLYSFCVGLILYLSPSWANLCEDPLKSNQRLIKGLKMLVFGDFDVIHTETMKV